MKFEVKINKNNLFVLISIIFILSGIFAVYAYNADWAASPGNPSAVGHSPDEISVYWDKILNKPAGFADNVDNEGTGGSTDCASGQVKVGSTCKTIPACTTTSALRYDGSSFSCVALSGGASPPAMTWKKLCDSKDISSGTCSTSNCGSYKVLKYSGGTAVCSGSSYVPAITACTAGGSCSVSGQYCFSGYIATGYIISGTCCGLSYPTLIDGTGAQLYQCSA